MNEELRKYPAATQSRWIVPLLVLIAGLMVANWLMPRRWDYGVIAPADEDLAKELKKAGDDGWEMVSARRAIDDPSLTSTKARYEIIFKRPKAF